MHNLRVDPLGSPPHLICVPRTKLSSRNFNIMMYRDGFRARSEEQHQYRGQKGSPISIKCCWRKSTVCQNRQNGHISMDGTENRAKWRRKKKINIFTDRIINWTIINFPIDMSQKFFYFYIQRLSAFYCAIVWVCTVGPSMMCHPSVISDIPNIHTNTYIYNIFDDAVFRPIFDL